MQGDNTQQIQKNRNNRFWTGVILLGIGGVLFADKLNMGIPHWVFTWQMLLIVIGAVSGIRNDFRGAGWLILMAIGGIFMWDEFIAYHELRKFLLPIIFITVGVIYILVPKSAKKERRREWRREQWHGNPAVPETDFTPTGEDYIDVHSVFSGVKRTILSKNFKGGKLTCVFGGAEIDFSKADIQGTAVLKLEEVFGGIKLIVPANWTVQNELEGVFHGFDDKRNYQAQYQADPNKILLIKGSAVFAGIEIRSF